MAKDEGPALHEVWGKLVAKAWDDPNFENRLRENPRQVLAEKGLELPDRLAVEVCGDDPVEAAEGVLYLPYPPSPSRELGDDELDAVAGGTHGLLQGMDSSGLGELSALQFKLGHHINSLNHHLDVLLPPINLPPRP